MATTTIEPPAPGRGFGLLACDGLQGKARSGCGLKKTREFSVSGEYGYDIPKCGVSGSGHDARYR